MSRARAAAIGSGAFVLAARLAGHDFWIEPSTFRPVPGAEVFVSLRVGQDFRGDPVPRKPALIERFALAAENGDAEIDGLPGADPAGSFVAPAPGLVWIAYRSRRTPITLEPDRFEKYLAEEGLEHVSKERARRGESGKPGREVYSRSVKSLLVSGAAGAASAAGTVAPAAKAFDRPLGLALEILLGADPRRAVPGKLPVRILWEGGPAEGLLVVAMNQASPDRKIRARTDARGAATLDLPEAGVWLVKAVRMGPAPAGVDADWESVWTSLTFEAP
ncbi:MAG TPA: DUF4198 domain-containing protein [Thermoanaerobaculia bacterium]|nr:DUF4198 domain-containing protein [Thermoanaerobaculia bacterium]